MIVVLSDFFLFSNKSLYPLHLLLFFSRQTLVQLACFLILFCLEFLFGIVTKFHQVSFKHLLF